MRKIGLALAVVATTAATGAGSAQAVTVSPLDQAKQRVLAMNCTALGGSPSLIDIGIECDFVVTQLNISRQVLARAVCGALGGRFTLLLGPPPPPIITIAAPVASVPIGYDCLLPGSPL